MKNICTSVVLIIGFLAFFASDAFGQRWLKRRRYDSIGLNVNAMNYFGEMAPDANFASLRILSTRPNIGATVTRKFTPRVSARVGLSWGRIYGDDKKSAAENEEDNLPRFMRNLNFRNDIIELNGVAIFDLFENRVSYRRRPDFAPYALIGLAIFHHNPKGYFSGQGLKAGYYELQPYGTEGQYAADRESKGYPKPYRKIQFSIPVGIGVKYKIARRWDLGFEMTWRKTFTDYLDDVSSNYADKGDLEAAKGRTAALLSDRSAQSGFTPVLTDANGYRHLNGFGTKGDQRGDVTDKDWYITTGVSIYYILPQMIKCPKFKF